MQLAVGLKGGPNQKPTRDVWKKLPGSAENEKLSDDYDNRQTHGKYPNHSRYAALLAPVVEQIVSVGASSTAIASVAGTAASVASTAAVRSTEACLFAWARQA